MQKDGGNLWNRITKNIKRKIEKMKKEYKFLNNKIRKCTTHRQTNNKREDTFY